MFRLFSRLLFTVLLFAVFTSAKVSKTELNKVAQACKAPTFEDANLNDVEAFDAYKTTVAGLLKEARYKELDCIADTARRGQEKFTGGMWKIHALYRGTSELKGHATDLDWQLRIKRIREWKSARPNSITARVALASAYINYAWFARGGETSDTVTRSGWQLFRERLTRAKSILDAASVLPSRCPEWFFAMQQVALGEGWDEERRAALLRKATALEPGYYYYYRGEVAALLPKWHGEPGDASKFAGEAADRVGGDAGDILYFQIGEEIVCACDEPEFGRMSWPRLQKGYAALEKNYGTSLVQLNELALMASKSEDAVAADEAFKRIGEHWNKETWDNNESCFNQSKTWAAQIGPAQLRTRKMIQEAETNLRSPEGFAYKKTVEKTLLALAQDCPRGENGEPQEIAMMVQVGKDGVAEDAWEHRLTVTSRCLSKKLYDSHILKQAAFPVPPHPDYWLDFQIDPATITASTN